MDEIFLIENNIKVEEEKQKQAKFNEMIKAIEERIESLKNM